MEELPHPEDQRGHSGSARRVREPCSAWCEDPRSPQGALTTAQGNTGRRGRHHTCGPTLAGSRNNNAPAATTRPTTIWTASLTPVCVAYAVMAHFISVVMGEGFALGMDYR